MKKIALFLALLLLCCAMLPSFAGCKKEPEDPDSTLTPDDGAPSEHVAVTGITLDRTIIAMTVGDSATLKAYVEPVGATNKSYHWSTSDAGVATVEDGEVTGVAPGSCTITVTAAEGSFTATCSVTVHARETVSFYLNGELYESREITDPNGVTITAPAAPADMTTDPTLTTYFSGWYLDEALLTPFEAGLTFDSTCAIYGYLADTSAEALSYELNNSDKALITGFAGESCPFLVIPTSIDGHEVYSVGEKAFRFDYVIRRVLFLDGASEIVRYAFEGCSQLASVELPATTLRALGDECFAECRSLRSIVIPGTIPDYNMGARIFSYCTSLADVTLSEGLTEIGIRMFEYCGALKEISFPAGLTCVDDYAFYYCAALQKVSLPNSVSEIGDGAFASCDELISVKLPSKKSLNMGSGSFRYCEKLAEVVDPAGYLNQLGISDGNLFDFGRGFHTDEDESRITEIDGFVFYNNGQKVYLLTYRGTDRVLTLPENFNGSNYIINSNAFYGRRDILSVTIPAAVTEIKENAFINATSLAEVINLSGLTFTIGENTNGGVAMNALEVHNGASKLQLEGDYAFYVGEEVTTLVKYFGADRELSLPSKTQGYEIAPYAFYENKRITRVTFPEGVTKINSNAFYSCYYLTSVTFSSTVESFWGYPFNGCLNLVEIINHSPNLSLEPGASGVAFYAKTVHQGASVVEQVGDYLFASVGGINYLIGYVGDSAVLTLPESYKGGSYVINDYAFYQRQDIVSVTLSAGVTAIGKNAFQYCQWLADVAFGENLVSIGNSAFSACYKLTAISIPASVTKIGQGAFGSCSELVSATFACKTGWKASQSADGSDPFTIREDILNREGTAAKALTTSSGTDVFGNRYWTRVEG